MKAVFDTNVLASGLVGLPRAESTPGELLRRWLAGDFELVISEHILTETRRTLDKSYFRRRVPSDAIEQTLATLRRRSVVVPTSAQVTGVASHDEDDLVLSAAASAQVDFLVTGDAPLLGVGTYNSVLILSPRAFLDLLDERTSDATARP